MDPTFDPSPELATLFPGLPGRALRTARGEVSAKERGALTSLSRSLCSEMLEGLTRQGLRPLRIWNWIPDINQGAGPDGFGAQEHYKQFNRGRREAWLAHDSTLGSVCAATAVGRQDGIPLLEVHALGTRNPVVHLENPRQVPFLEYSKPYGAPPCSRRATLELAPGGLALFVAGTSSIRGERTVHPEPDGARLAEQVEETLENLASLLSAQTLRAQVSDPRLTPTLRWRNHAVRVYLRDLGAAAAIQARIAERLEVEPSALHFIPADICRRPLDVEIELVALQAG